MGMAVAEQAYALLQAILLGAGVGLLYDLFRILRVRIRLRLVGGLLDFFFWVAVTVALFVHAIVAQGGVVRVYMITSVFLGATLYFFAFSLLILRVGYLFADIFGFIWKIMTAPLRIFLCLCKKIIKKAKKLFHSLKKWYNIGMIPDGIMNAMCANAKMEGSAPTNEVSENVLFDQNCGARPLDCDGHRTARATQSAPDCPAGQGLSIHPAGGASPGECRPGRRGREQ